MDLMDFSVEKKILMNKIIIWVTTLISKYYLIYFHYAAIAKFHPNIQ